MPNTRYIIELSLFPRKGEFVGPFVTYISAQKWLHALTLSAGITGTIYPLHSTEEF